MEPDIKQKFQKANQYSQRGDSYRQEGNYEQAAKCYIKVSKLLTLILQTAKTPKSRTDIQKKIQKYTNMGKQALDQHHKKMSKKVVISKFGFPQQKNNVSLINLSKKKTLNERRMTYNKTEEENCKVMPELEGLVCRNLKHSFKDIVGMEEVKQALYQAVIFPQKRPDLFQGIRAPPRGVLLYGPPGNGKTFVVKALAKQSGCVFYGLSAGSIVNKFVGQSEKMLKKVFQSAKKTKPSIIFIDEIDSIITARTENEQDSSRRLKTQFLVQFDSIQPNDRVIVVGATNFPGQLDLAALRRFNKMIFIGLPDKQSRKGVVENNLKDITSQISKSQMKTLIKNLDGYTISEITDIVKQACMLPIRDIKKDMVESVSKSKIRPVKYSDFEKVISGKKPLLTKEDLKKFQGRFH